MEKKQVEELLLLMQGAYPTMFTRGKGVGKAQLKMWRDYLLDWDYKRAKTNLMKHIENSVYEPKVVDIKPYKRKRPDNYASDWETFKKMIGD